MIKIENSYYSCEDEPINKESSPQPQPRQRQETLEVIGDVKGYLQTVAEQIKNIKELRMKQKEQSSKNKIFLEKLNPRGEDVKEGQNVTLHLAVPEELYQLDQQIAGIQARVQVNELVRQKIQRKGKIAERAKMLSAQIHKLAQKSPDIIENSILKYAQALDEKEENIKAMFLYEAFTTTQGLTEEMDALSTYLSSLSEIQSKLKGMASKKSIVENHNTALEKRVEVSKKISELQAYMREQYSKLEKEIDSI